jgi:hypothetical protein
VQPHPAEPAHKGDRRRERGIPIRQPLDLEVRPSQQRLHLRSRVAPVDVGGAIVRAFQELECRQVQNQFPPGAQNAVRFIGGQSVIDPGVAPNVERQDEIERALGKRKFVHAGAREMRTRVAFRGDGDRMVAVVDAAQLGPGKFPAENGQRSTGAAAGVKHRKGRRGGLDRIRHVLP